MTKEFMRLICDQHLGAGSTRDVWGCSWLPGVAFKFEPDEGDFANIAEWEFWKETEDQPWQRRWLAPCLAISPCGGVLAMKRCDVIDIDMLPKEVPVWVTDTKITIPVKGSGATTWTCAIPGPALGNGTMRDGLGCWRRHTVWDGTRHRLWCPGDLRSPRMQ